MEALREYNAALEKHGFDLPKVIQELFGDGPDRVFRDKSRIIRPPGRENTINVVHDDIDFPYAHIVTPYGAMPHDIKTRQPIGEATYGPLSDPTAAPAAPVVGSTTTRDTSESRQAQARANVNVGVAAQQGANVPLFGGPITTTPTEEYPGVSPEVRAASERVFRDRPPNPLVDVEPTPGTRPPRVLKDVDTSKAYKHVADRPFSESALFDTQEPDPAGLVSSEHVGPYARRTFDDGSEVHYNLGPAEGADGRYHPVKQFTVTVPALKNTPGAFHTYERDNGEMLSGKPGKDTLGRSGKPNPLAGVQIPTPVKVKHRHHRTGSTGESHAGEWITHQIGGDPNAEKVTPGRGTRSQFLDLQRSLLHGIPIEELSAPVDRNARVSSELAKLSPGRLADLLTGLQKTNEELSDEDADEIMKGIDVGDWIKRNEHFHTNNLARELGVGDVQEFKANELPDTDYARRDVLKNIYGAVRRLAAGPTKKSEKKEGKSHAYDKFVVGGKPKYQAEAVASLMDLAQGMGTAYGTHSGEAYSKRSRDSATKAMRVAEKPAPVETIPNVGGRPTVARLSDNQPIAIANGVVHTRQKAGTVGERLPTPMDPERHQALLAATTVGELRQAMLDHEGEPNVVSAPNRKANQGSRGKRLVQLHKAVVQLEGGGWVEVHREHPGGVPVNGPQGTPAPKQPKDIVWALHDVSKNKVVVEDTPEGEPPSTRPQLLSLAGATKLAKERGGRHTLIPVVHPQFDAGELSDETIPDTVEAGKRVLAGRGGGSKIVGPDDDAKGRPLSGMVNGGYSHDSLAGTIPVWADPKKHVPREVDEDGTRQVLWTQAAHQRGFQAVNDQMDIHEDAMADRAEADRATAATARGSAQLEPVAKEMSVRSRWTRQQWNAAKARAYGHLKAVSPTTPFRPVPEPATGFAGEGPRKGFTQQASGTRRR